MAEPCTYPDMMREGHMVMRVRRELVLICGGCQVLEVASHPTMTHWREFVDAHRGCADADVVVR